MVRIPLIVLAGLVAAACTAGADGGTAAPGAPGATVPAAAALSEGPAGPVGPEGAVGPQGDTGPRGEVGPAGAVGPPGPRGAPGPTGSAGPVGPAGPAGATGATGPVGPAGPTGATGPAGAAGADGAAAPTMTYRVGDIGPAGGFIFFVDTAGEFADFDYLEAAPAGWSGGGDPQLPLCDDAAARATSRSAWAAHALGAGQENTAALVDEGCGTDGTAVGAAVALSLDVGGATYADWYVPSLAELHLLVREARARGAGGFEVTFERRFVTSTLGEAATVITFQPVRGETAQRSQTEGIFLRPVRRFSEPTS